MRYRKKPVEVQAWQLPAWDDPNWFSVALYVDECIEIADWCGGISQMMLADDEPSPNGIRGLYGAHMIVPTPEGQMIARPGDWIIRGVKGEFYPCRPDVFESTYERVV